MNTIGVNCNVLDSEYIGEDILILDSTLLIILSLPVHRAMCITLECFGMKYICCSILTTVSCSVIVSYSVSMSWLSTSYAWYAAAYNRPVNPL